MLTELFLAVALHGAVADSNEGNGAIGIRIGINHSIQRVYADTPAERAGLKPGDRVLSVCDAANSHHIEGVAGSEVILIVRRGAADLIFKATRVPERLIRRK
jgi:C-terminal processing protease CtpA/Prc